VREPRGKGRTADLPDVRVTARAARRDEDARDGINFSCVQEIRTLTHEFTLQLLADARIHHDRIWRRAEQPVVESLADDDV
jgi:hypothetical protein